MALTLKVRILEVAATTSLQFNAAESAASALKRINERVANNQLSTEECGLLHRPTNDSKQDRWLDPEKTLALNGVRNNDLVELRKRFRPLKIRLSAAGALKTVMIDDTQPLGELVANVCKRIGLANNEEYSMTLEESVEGAKKKDDKKADKSKKGGAAAGAEEDAWLDHTKTLREQGIADDAILILKKKFFFSDQSIDKSDPVQINMLYGQSKTAILNGTHPCTQDEAVEFAALQMQVEYGEHLPDRHKPGFIDDLRLFLPAEYVKVKHVEKLVYVEHKKLSGTSEINAKYLYIQKCRSLKTYGITFFLVKEKVKGKNKLVTRLMGITKDAVMRVDERTKEILKTWPLTTVRRWAAAPTSFTLDFGDYSESFYSVQTTEGEQMSQLIAGYIDIILKERKERDRAEARAAAKEETTAAAPARAVASRAAVSVAGVAAPARAESVRLQPATAQVTTPAQTALLNLIQQASDATMRALTDMSHVQAAPTVGSDSASQAWRQNTADMTKQSILAQLAAVTAGTASIVTLTSVGQSAAFEIDYNSLGAAVSTLSSNLITFSKNVQALAGLMPPSAGAKMLEAGRTLCNALKGLLPLVSAAAQGPANRQEVLTAATGIGVATSEVLHYLGELTEENKRVQEQLMVRAKAVAAATATLITAAKTLSAECKSANAQSALIFAAKSAALSTTQLVSITKVLAATINASLCQEQVIECARVVAGTVEGVVSASQGAGARDEALGPLGQSASTTIDALNDLIHFTRSDVVSGAQGSSQYAEPCAAIVASSDRLTAVLGNTSEMVQQTKMLAQAMSALVKELKSEAANEQNREKQQRLLLAGRTLADATTKAVEAAKAAARRPDDATSQTNLRAAIADLRAAVDAAVGNAIRKQVLTSLEAAARNASAAAIQLLSAVHAAMEIPDSPSVQQQLAPHARTVRELAGRVVAGLKQYATSRDSASAQLALVNACKNFIGPVQKLCNSSRAAAPSVPSPSCSLQLSNFSKHAAAAIADLRAAVVKASEACGSLDLQSASDTVQGLAREVDEAATVASQGQLVALPGQTRDASLQGVGMSHRAVLSALTQLSAAAAMGDTDCTGSAAQSLAVSMQSLVFHTRGACATHSDRAVASPAFASARAAVTEASRTIEEARITSQQPGNTSVQSRMLAATRGLQSALDGLIAAMPGQREVDVAIVTVQKDASKATTVVPAKSSSSASYTSKQANLSHASAALIEASTRWTAVTAKGSPAELVEASRAIAAAHAEVLQASMDLAAITTDKRDQDEILRQLGGMSSTALRLLQSGKQLSLDHNEGSFKGQLAAAARGITVSINALLDICLQSSPGQKECDSAIRTMQASALRLDQASSAALSEDSFFDCLELVMTQSKALGAAMSGIATHARSGATDEFVASVHGAAVAVQALADSASQATFLVGVSHPSTEAGQQGLLDLGQFSRAQNAVAAAVEVLLSPASSQEDILSAAGNIAKSTSYLCQVCKQASNGTRNAVAKKQFLKFAKDIATSTSALVSGLRVLAQANSVANRQACEPPARALLSTISEMGAFSQPAEYTSTPAVLGDAARQAQEPLLQAGRVMVSHSCQLIATAKALVANPKDARQWQELAVNSKAVSDSIKGLIGALRDRAPGQLECDDAILVLTNAVSDIDDALMSASIGTLAARSESNVQGFQEQSLEVLSSLGDVLDAVHNSAKADATQLASSVQHLGSLSRALLQACVGLASKLSRQPRQVNVLEETKTILESALQLVYAARDAGGNPKNTQAQPALADAHANTRAALNDLTALLATVAVEEGIVSAHLQAISAAVARLDQEEAADASALVSFQEQMDRACRGIARISQDVVANAVGTAAELSALAQEITASFTTLISEARRALACLPPDEQSEHLKSTLRDLGESLSDLIQSMGSVQKGGDNSARRELVAAARAVGGAVGGLLSALQAGSRGTQACLSALSALDGILVDLETTAMFASAGSLAGDPDDHFSDFRDEVLVGSRNLVESTKLLVAAATGPQEPLSEATQGALASFSRLCEDLKNAATALGPSDMEAQTMLLNAARDVGSALAALFHSVKSASARLVKEDSALESLKADAKVLVGSITSLLKTVKSVEDAAARGLRALEAAIEAIDTDLQQPNDASIDVASSSPEDLVRSTRPVTLATAKLMSAISSGRTEDLTSAANNSRKVVADLLKVSRSAAVQSKNAALAERAIASSKKCAAAVRALLNLATESPASDTKTKALAHSRAIAAAVAEVTAAAETLKGDDFVDMEDPNVVAEQELLSAAATIEAAAKKLATLQPKKEHRQSVYKEMPFQEQILEASRAIVAASQALVVAASAAQREHVAAGLVKPREGEAYLEDSDWSSGLVSAAKVVVVATNSLCEAANATVQGVGTTEKLIASAKAVANSTAQLLVACKVRGDAQSPTTLRLVAAGNAVKRAADLLVKSAQDNAQAAAPASDEINVELSDRLVRGMAMELEASEAVMRQERELELAKRALQKIRATKYRKGGPAPSPAPKLTR